MTERSVPEARRRILERIARLVERSRALTLNRSDGAFRERGGEVFFVVDTNVVLAFVQPFRNADQMGLFHHPSWQPNKDEVDADYDTLCDSVSAQAALLATEFIMSPDMKAAAGHIFMSIPHLEELEEQVGYVLSGRNEDGEPDEESPTDPAGELIDDQGRERIAWFAELLHSPLERAWQQMNTDRLFKEGLDESKLSRGDRERIRTAYVLSGICRVLAKDRVDEPYRQIVRLTVGDRSDLLVPIEWEFPDDDDAEGGKTDLSEDERRWSDCLRDEEKVRRKQAKAKGLTPSTPRRKKSIQRDAKTLALLGWISRERLSANQRIVFITGDGLLLDAYRREYLKADEPEDFLLRSLAQYAPQYNLHDANAPLVQSSELFERTRSTIESSTLPIILTLLQAYKIDPGKPQYFASSRVRDRFCVEVADGKVAPDLVDQLLVDPMTHHSGRLQLKMEELDYMAAELRAVERIAMGMLPHLVSNRVTEAIEDRRRLSEALGAAHDPGEARTIAEKWLGGHLQAAMDRAYRFALPRAAKLIHDWQTTQSPEVPRTPAALQLWFPVDGKGVTINQWIARTRRNRLPALKELQRKSPALVFALASWLTHHGGLLSEAIHFADQARQAANYPDPTAEPYLDAEGLRISPEAIHRECLYLKALLLRIRMASTQPGSMYSEDIWLRDLERAVQALGESGDCGATAVLRPRDLRARSERAAVGLTYCAWAATGHLQEIGVYQRAGASIKLGNIIADAIEDLHVVSHALEAAREELSRRVSAEARKMREAVLDWVAVQSFANHECARLICEALLCTALDSAPRIDPVSDVHKIIEAYRLSAARRIATDPEAAENLVHDMEQIILPSNALALDRVMLGAILERWKEVAPLPS